MKPVLEQIETGSGSSIKVQSYTRPMINVPLHFHPEHELVYIQKGSGRLLIGDVEEGFGEGELFFIPGSVPHLFTDEHHRTGKAIAGKVLVVQFKEMLTEQLNGLPEFAAVNEFISNAGAGYRINVTSALPIRMRKMERLDGLSKLNALLDILNTIVSEHQFESLGTLSKRPMTNHIVFLKLRKLNNFLAAYAQSDFSVGKAAALLEMNKASFCRFLKRETGKTFSEHLCFHRINLACRLLRETGKTVTDICYAAGFNNPSYFFRRFKSQKGVSPAEYRQSLAVI
ncbi:MAG: helix-turn-helix domain-containing protein [Chitinophagaceae bacterium]|nr:helix-turn-helix domain-containing protein [Chitinophagaceae bacterium]